MNTELKPCPTELARAEILNEISEQEYRRNACDQSDTAYHYHDGVAFGLKVSLDHLTDAQNARTPSKAEEAETILSAWQKQFGTTQLTHAVARLERAEKERDTLRAELEKAEEENSELKAQLEIYGR